MPVWKTGHELWSQVALVSAYFAADYLSLPCCFSLPSPGFFTLVNWVRAEAPLVDQASSCLSSDPHATPRSCAFMIVPFCRGGNRLRGNLHGVPELGMVGLGFNPWCVGTSFLLFQPTSLVQIQICCGCLPGCLAV